MTKQLEAEEMIKAGPRLKIKQMKDVKNPYEEGILESESEHTLGAKNQDENVDCKNAPQLPLAPEYVEVVDIDAPPQQRVQEPSKFKLFMNHIDEETEEESIAPFVPENPGDVPPPPGYLLQSLEETPLQTIKRDLFDIFGRGWIVINIFSKKKPLRRIYEQWDIFGPLLIAVSFSLLLEFSMPYRRVTQGMVALVIMSYFLFGTIIGVNNILIKARTNIMGIFCLICYTTIPLLFSQIIIMVINVFKKAMTQWVQNLLVSLFSLTASCWTGLVCRRVFKRILPEDSRFKGYYPVGVFLFVMTSFQIAFCLYRGDRS